jgi:hypothetical protein
VIGKAWAVSTVALRSERTIEGLSTAQVHIQITRFSREKRRHSEPPWKSPQTATADTKQNTKEKPAEFSRYPGKTPHLHPFWHETTNYPSRKGGVMETVLL